MISLDFHNQLKYLSKNFLDYLVNSSRTVNSTIDTDTIKKIISLQEFLMSNVSQLDSRDTYSLLELQKSVYLLNKPGLPTADIERLRLLDTITAASIKMISLSLNINQLKLPQDLSQIRLMLPPHAQAYVLAYIINRDQIPIKELSLNPQEVREMASYLTYLDCQDALDGWNVEEIESFLSTCSNLKHLKINSSNIKKLQAFPMCEEVDCSGCRQLEHLGALPKCERFTCNECPLLKQNEFVHENVNFSIYASIIKPKIEEICRQYRIPPQFLLGFFKIYGNIEQNFQINGLFNGRTPLIKAIDVDKPPLIKALLALGADTHQCDVRGVSPYMWAIKKNNFELVKLWGGTAEINHRDQNGESPLFWAVKESEEAKMVDLVYKLGDQEVNVYNHQGLSPLIFAMFNKKPALEEMLLNLGADQEYAIEGCKRIFLAHIWGVGGFSILKDKKGKSHNLRLEGCRDSYIMQMLSEYGTSFFESSDLIDESMISKKEQQVILESLERSYPLIDSDEILTRARLGKPCVILAGIEGHWISMVVFQGKLVIFNRGMGGKDNAAEIYKLPEEITVDFIKKLTTIYGTGTIDSSAATFNKMITDLNLPYLGGFKQKDQKVGNCGWASAKGALGVLIGKKLYKIFTSFSRAKGLEEYVHTSKQIDWVLVDKIKTKAKKKAELLGPTFVLQKSLENQKLI